MDYSLTYNDGNNNEITRVLGNCHEDFFNKYYLNPNIVFSLSFYNTYKNSEIDVIIRYFELINRFLKIDYKKHIVLKENNNNTTKLSFVFNNSDVNEYKHVVNVKLLVYLIRNLVYEASSYNKGKIKTFIELFDSKKQLGIRNHELLLVLDIFYRKIKDGYGNNITNNMFKRIQLNKDINKDYLYECFLDPDNLRLYKTKHSDYNFYINIPCFYYLDKDIINDMYKSYLLGFSRDHISYYAINNTHLISFIEHNINNKKLLKDIKTIYDYFINPKIIFDPNIIKLYLKITRIYSEFVENNKSFNSQIEERIASINNQKNRYDLIKKK
jgi:hypothetical protein